MATICQVQCLRAESKLPCEVSIVLNPILIDTETKAQKRSNMLKITEKGTVTARIRIQVGLTQLLVLKSILLLSIPWLSGSNTTHLT